MKRLLFLLALTGCTLPDRQIGAGLRTANVCDWAAQDGANVWLYQDKKHNFCWMIYGHGALQLPCEVFEQCKREQQGAE